MFFKNRREAKKRADRQQELDGFQAEIDAAQKLDDPAAKLLELERINTSMTALTKGKQAAAENWGVGAYMGAAMTASAGLLTGAAFVVTAFAFPPGAMLLAVIPGAIGGIVAGTVANEKVKNSLTEGLQPLLDGLAEKQSAVSAVVEAVVKDNLERLAASPRFNEMQERPALRDIFMAAMQKRLSGQEAPPSLVPPKRPEGGLNL